MLSDTKHTLRNPVWDELCAHPSNELIARRDRHTRQRPEKARTATRTVEEPDSAQSLSKKERATDYSETNATAWNLVYYNLIYLVYNKYLGSLCEIK